MTIQEGKRVLEAFDLQASQEVGHFLTTLQNLRDVVANEIQTLCLIEEEKKCKNVIAIR
jgi:hypothetical protein